MIELNCSDNNLGVSWNIDLFQDLASETKPFMVGNHSNSAVQTAGYNLNSLPAMSDSIVADSVGSRFHLVENIQTISQPISHAI